MNINFFFCIQLLKSSHEFLFNQATDIYFSAISYTDKNVEGSYFVCFSVYR